MYALPHQPDAVTGVALSPDSRLLVSADMSGTLKLWDLSKRTELMIIQESGMGAGVFALSHDGSRLATVIHGDRRPTTVKVWNVAERKVTHGVSVRGLAACDGVHSG